MQGFDKVSSPFWLRCFNFNKIYLKKYFEIIDINGGIKIFALLGNCLQHYGCHL